MKINRRHFLALTLVSSGTVLFYKNQKITLFESKIQTMLALSYHLYPSTSLGFGASDLQMVDYLLFVLGDERIMQEDKDYLLRGAVWFEEHSQELKGEILYDFNA